MRQGSWWAAAALAVCVGAPTAADIGVPVASGRAGPFEVQVLVAQAPLRAGPSEWNVFVSDADGRRILLDADLELTLHAPSAHPAAPGPGRGDSDDHPLVLHPDPVQARSRIFQTIVVHLFASGVWHGTLRVGHEGATESVDFQVVVAPASSALVSHWRAFAIVPAGVVLLALHQTLRQRRAARSGRV